MEMELPKEYAEGALADLTADSSASRPRRHGLWQGPVGDLGDLLATRPRSRGRRTIDNQPKAAPEVDAPKGDRPGGETKDVAVHTASGTVVYRYEEHGRAKWKLRP